MKEEKRHVGRPTNEEVKQRKTKKLLKILIPCIIFVFLVTIIMGSRVLYLNNLVGLANKMVTKNGKVIKKVGDSWYCYNKQSKEKCYGYVNYKKKTYYFDKNNDGKMVINTIINIPTYNISYPGDTSIQEIAHYKYFNKNGQMIKKGFIKWKGDIYYADETSDLVLDRVTEIDGKRYKFEKNGKVIKNYVEKQEFINGETEYSGWQKSDILAGADDADTNEWGYSYALYDYNAKIIQYIAYGADGHFLDNEWKKIDNKKYYFKDGKSVFGFVKIHNKWYLFDNNSQMYKGSEYKYSTTVVGGGIRKYKIIVSFEKNHSIRSINLKIGGLSKVYFFFGKGSLYNGFKKFNGHTHYFKNGEGQIGWQKINNNWYYFNFNGEMQTGWQKLRYNGKNNWYYFEHNGKMKTGWLTYKGEKYYFDSDGKRHSDWLETNGDYYYFNPLSGTMVKNTTIKIDGVEYKFNSKGICRDGGKCTITTKPKTTLKKIDIKCYYDNNKIISEKESVLVGKKFYCKTNTNGTSLSATKNGLDNNFTNNGTNIIKLRYKTEGIKQITATKDGHNVTRIIKINSIKKTTATTTKKNVPNTQVK